MVDRCALVRGCRLSSKPLRGAVTNRALVLDEGRVQTSRAKHHLPNYGVFDEVRVFRAGPLPGPVNLRGLRVGLMVCEDMWFPDVAETLEEIRRRNI